MSSSSALLEKQLGVLPFKKEKVKAAVSHKTYEQGFDDGYQKAYAEMEKDKAIYLKNKHSFDELYAK
jgi:hypothetical protein